MKDWKEIVRQEVERVLSEYLAREKPPSTTEGVTSKELIILFSGTRWPEDQFFNQLAALAESGPRLVCVASQTFHAAHSLSWESRAFPPNATRVVSPPEKWLYEAAKEADAVVVACLSLNSAAKLSLGIADSVPTILIRQALEHGKPVLVAEESTVIRQAAILPNAPPKLRRLAEDAYHGVAELGVRFVAPADLCRALAETFYVPVNETPKRLAKTRPTKRRVFVTSEDIWKVSARGEKQIIVPEDAVVTDEARDYAKRVGVEILRQ
ncbi:MAG: hypothetical protein N2Z21_02485 [Candidatus Sumerlaeaceae bacterium]|nr:hypothetical protein [Candidatus Sumerlaeaceae bacterium]